MPLETVFSFCNLTAMAGWALLIALPRWRYSATLVAAVVIPALLALVYSVLIASEFGSAEGGFGSLAGVAALFRNPALLLAGWIHYLAFDLFVGAWEVRDAQRLAISHWLVIPCLLLTFTFGPAGLLLYLLIRAGAGGRMLVESPHA
jgi:hypothetical protein